jgi:hypothetical protein
MRFQLTRTSWHSWSTEDKPPVPGDPRPRWDSEHSVWIVEIETLDELLSFSDGGLILDPGHGDENGDLWVIEIYDDYRE